jgi:hypothetical protein
MLIDWLQQRMTVVWIVYFALLEALSWQTSRIPPCIVKTSAQYAKNADGHECPTLHVFLIETSAIVFEKLGDPHTATAVFTALLFVATFFLWMATRKLVQGADRTAEKQLRAYVTTIGGHMKWEAAEVDSVIEIEINIKNSGQTPAYNFNIQFSDPTILDSDATPWEDEPVPQDDWGFAGVLGPGAVTYVGRPLPVTNEIVDEISAGQKTIFAWGRINYVDIFGRKRTYVFRNTNAPGRLKRIGNSWGVRNIHDDGD